MHVLAIIIRSDVHKGERLVHTIGSLSLIFAAAVLAEGTSHLKRQAAVLFNSGNYCSRNGM